MAWDVLTLKQQHENPSYHIHALICSMAHAESSGRLITRKLTALNLQRQNFSFSYSALLKEEERLLGYVIWRQFADII